MITLINTEKVFDNIYHSHVIILQKVGIKGAYLNTIKAIYEKTRANSIFNGEKLKAFSLKSGTKQGC